MRIIDGLELPGRKVEIPDCNRDDLPEFFREMGFRMGAEIGVRLGLFSEKLAAGGQLVYAIDPWLDYEDYRESHTMKMEQFYKEAKQRLSGLTCKIIRKKSMEALEDFEDGSLDWVYIDGNHSLPYVVQDLFYWSKKERSGGIISGDDYRIIKSKDPYRCNVVPAVEAFVSAARIPKYYILGRKQIVEGEKRDKFRNFMWINP